MAKLLLLLGGFALAGLAVWQLFATFRSGTFRGPVAKFFRARFVSQLRSAEPVSAQPWIEIRPSGRPSHNRKLGRAALSCSSHTSQKNFATGPSLPPTFRPYNYFSHKTR